MSKLKSFLLIGALLLVALAFVALIRDSSSHQNLASPRGSYPANTSDAPLDGAGAIHRQSAVAPTGPVSEESSLEPERDVDLIAYGQLQGFLSDGELGDAGSADLEVYKLDAVGMGMSSRTISSFSTGGDGKFGARLPVGKYVLVAKKVKASLPQLQSSNPSPNRGASIPLDEFQIFENQVTSLSVVLNLGNVVYGQVINSDDPASTSFMVRMIRESDERDVAWAMVFADSRATSSDQVVAGQEAGSYRHGVFAFPRFSPGGYRLEVSLITGPGGKVNKPWTMPFLMPDTDLDLGIFEISAHRLRGEIGAPDPVPLKRIKRLGGVKLISGKILEGESFDDFVKRISASSEADG